MAEPGAVKRGLYWTDGITRAGIGNRGRTVYLKDYNQTYNTRASSAHTRNLREATALAAFFEELRRRGVYPPDAGFAVCKSADGHPGVIATMPEMNVSKYNYNIKRYEQERYKHFRNTLTELLQDRDALHRDLNHYNLQVNSGKHANGELYFFDLHAVHPYHRRKVLEWYERHLAEKAARGKAANGKATNVKNLTG